MESAPYPAGTRPSVRASIAIVIVPIALVAPADAFVDSTGVVFAPAPVPVCFVQLVSLALRLPAIASTRFDRLAQVVFGMLHALLAVLADFLLRSSSGSRYDGRSDAPIPNDNIHNLTAP